VVRLDDFTVVMEFAGDTSEMVAFLCLENELSASAEPKSRNGLHPTFQLSGGLFLSDLHRHGGGLLILLGLLVDPQRFHVSHVKEPTALPVPVGGDAIGVVELLTDSPDLRFPFDNALTGDDMGEYRDDPVLVVLRNNGLVAIRFREMEQDVVGAAFARRDKIRLRVYLAVDSIVSQRLDPASCVACCLAAAFFPLIC